MSKAISNVIDTAVNTVRSMFSEVTFSLPDRTPSKTKYGGLAVANGEYYLLGPTGQRTLKVTGTLWLTEKLNKATGDIEEDYSMGGIGRGIGPVPGDVDSQADFLAFRNRFADEGEQFYAKAIAAKNAA